MAKTLKITFPEKCIGCELCVAEVQRQLNKVGLDGSPIRVFRNNEDHNVFGNVTYIIELDNTVDSLAINKIKDICPTGVFTVEEKTESANLLE